MKSTLKTKIYAMLDASGTPMGADVIAKRLGTDIKNIRDCINKDIKTGQSQFVKNTNIDGAIIYIVKPKKNAKSSAKPKKHASNVKAAIIEVLTGGKKLRSSDIAEITKLQPNAVSGCIGRDMQSLKPIFIKETIDGVNYFCLRSNDTTEDVNSTDARVENNTNSTNIEHQSNKALTREEKMKMIVNTDKASGSIKVITAVRAEVQSDPDIEHQSNKALTREEKMKMIVNAVMRGASDIKSILLSKYIGDMDDNQAKGSLLFAIRSGYIREHRHPSNIVRFECTDEGINFIQDIIKNESDSSINIDLDRPITSDQALALNALLDKEINKTSISIKDLLLNKRLLIKNIKAGTIKSHIKTATGINIDQNVIMKEFNCS